ncbi:hypothetical protein K443DRAFT_6285 [Laccaria amethystina LaAM-08-1]|uniref:Uncharacterized protein n=1 Tax=Laccaria amethystina LaAM-08-1 TaxID=1095629 RepID=A0A0C9XL18_9AGAR|nr:hypothetical protein K443DRAFT_6285 [Laccaria amethystina LaAM-08-1]
MNIMQMSQRVTAVLQPTTTPQPTDAAKDNHGTMHDANDNARPPVHHDRPNNEDGRPQTRMTAQTTTNTPKRTTPIHHGSQTTASAHEEIQGTMGPGATSPTATWQPNDESRPMSSFAVNVATTAKHHQQTASSTTYGRPGWPMTMTHDDKAT